MSLFGKFFGEKPTQQPAPQETVSDEKRMASFSEQLHNLRTSVRSYEDQRSPDDAQRQYDLLDKINKLRAQQGLLEFKNFSDFDEANEESAETASV